MWIVGLLFLGQCVGPTCRSFSHPLPAPAPAPWLAPAIPLAPVDTKAVDAIDLEALRAQLRLEIRTYVRSFIEQELRRHPHRFCPCSGTGPTERPTALLHMPAEEILPAASMSIESSSCCSGESDRSSLLSEYAGLAVAAWVLGLILWGWSIVLSKGNSQ